MHSYNTVKRPAQNEMRRIKLLPHFFCFIVANVYYFWYNVFCAKRWQYFWKFRFLCVDIFDQFHIILLQWSCTEQCIFVKYLGPVHLAYQVQTLVSTDWQSKLGSKQRSAPVRYSSLHSTLQCSAIHNLGILLYSTLLFSNPVFALFLEPFLSTLFEACTVDCALWNFARICAECSVGSARWFLNQWCKGKFLCSGGVKYLSILQAWEHFKNF